MNANPSPPPKKKKTGCFISIMLLLLIVFCGILAAGFGIYSYREFDHSAKIIKDTDIYPISTKPYTLSNNQQELVNRLDYPDSFTITFYYEAYAPGNKTWVRDETWRYYDETTAYTFYNGELQEEFGLEPIAPGWLPAMYTPDQYFAFAKLQEVLDNAQIHDYFEHPLEDALVKNGRLYFAPGVTFGLADGELNYVETITMAELGGTNE
jgi:hypothetical protein